MNKSLAFQLLNFQKSMLDASYNMAVNLQDQGHEMMARICEKNPLVPRGNEEICAHWVEYIKENQDNCKAYMDSNFDRIREFVNASPQRL